MGTRPGGALGSQNVWRLLRSREGAAACADLAIEEPGFWFWLDLALTPGGQA